MSAPRTAWPQALVALLTLLVLSVVLGLGYPAAVTGIARLTPHSADGSFVVDADGAVVGSALLGQSFTDAEGNPVVTDRFTMIVRAKKG